ncbi:hypothetical protein FZW96_03390 [Bacillus sp. BGMRC 2118]|nr:hypothetical protein FZW96_03390 [Bacillus sp. BGMRC 2118]
MEKEDIIALIENMPTGLMVVDAKGFVHYINETGKHLLEIVSSDELREIASRFLTRQKTTMSFEQLCTPVNNMQVLYQKEDRTMKPFLLSSRYRNEDEIALTFTEDVSVYNEPKGIDQHFLFNTLNTIVGLIRFNPDGARHVTVQLANYLRISESLKSLDLVSLAKELELVQAYIEIIFIRFSDRVEIVLNSSIEEATAVSIPPFTLKAILENILENSLLRRGLGGKIILTINETNDGCIVSFEYNCEDETELNHGLHAINDELFKQLGEGSRLVLKSEEGVTRLTFLLPFSKERLI